MGAKTLIIKKLWRLPSTVAEDEITFDPGVNVLVGDKDNDFMLFTNCKKAFKLGYYIHKLKKAFELMGPILKEIEPK